MQRKSANSGIWLVWYFNFSTNKPITSYSEKISIETRKDPELGKIVKILEKRYNLSKNGNNAPESCYTVSGNYLIFKHRVVIPIKFRRDVLQELDALRPTTAAATIALIYELFANYGFDNGTNFKRVQWLSDSCVR